MFFNKHNSHQYIVTLSARTLQIHITESAHIKLKKLDTPLHVEMQTHLGCIPRKKTVFKTVNSDSNSVQVTPNLLVSYQSLLGGTACSVDFKQTQAEKENTSSMLGTPQWLNIDYLDNQWNADFGLNSTTDYTPSLLCRCQQLILKIFHPLRMKHE